MSSQPSAPASVLGLKANVMCKGWLLPSNNSKYFYPLHINHTPSESGMISFPLFLLVSIQSQSLSFSPQDPSEVSLLL